MREKKLARICHRSNAPWCQALRYHHRCVLNSVRRGVAVLQCYATAELGVIAYETPALEGMVVNESVIVEIVRPGTGDPVGEGEVGEVVVTSFNPDYPMIRLATGDLSAVLAGRSPCGRTNMRIKGWMGRADQTTKVKGMFVHPSQVAEVAKRHPELGRLRLRVDAARRAGCNDACRRMSGADNRARGRRRGELAVGDQAQRRRRTCRAGEPAERRQNHR